MNKVSETARELKTLEEDQGTIDFDKIIAEVFDDIRNYPSNYHTVRDSRTDSNIPTSFLDGSRPHDGTFIKNRSSVTILGPEDPQGPIDLLKYFLFKGRRAYRIVTPVSAVLSPSQVETYKELHSIVENDKKQRLIKERIANFREDKGKARGSGISYVPGEITFGSSGQLRIATGQGNSVTIKCPSYYDPTVEY